MYQVGILELSGTLEENYIDVLSAGVIVFQKEKSLSDFTSNKNFDGLLIIADSQTDVSELCSILLKLKEKDLFVWIFGESIPQVNRLMYLQLGVDGNFEAFAAHEAYLMMKNALVRNDSFAKKKKSLHIYEDGDQEITQFQLNAVNQSVIINGGKEISLTRLEYQILNILSSNPQQTFDYTELYEKIWGQTNKDVRPRIANIVFHLRGKIEKDPLNPKLIKTVRSKGYMFCLSI